MKYIIYIKMDTDRMRFVFMEDLNMDHDFIFDNEHLGYNNINQSYFTQFMIFLSVVQLSLLLSMIIVSKFVYKPMVEKALRETLDIDLYKLPYEYKYNLKNVGDKGEDVNPNSYVYELTPGGGVFMKYDVDEEGFVYWSDKSVRFNYLDVVARKYCKTFLRKNLYIPNGIYDLEDVSDIEDEEYDGDIDSDDTNNVEETDTSEVDDCDNNEESETQEEDSVFLTKKASSSTNNGTSSIENPVVIKRNKFIHKGKVSEFKLLQRYEPKEVVTKKKMTFDTFKDLFYGSNV
jgi:hypothetical protein